MAKKKYPIGIQTFEDIREYDFYYVDKTNMIYELAKEKGYYFLARPRRFGKSLLLSTLQAYFEGKKDLFNGLAMEQLEHDWTKYPVLRLDFNGANYAADGELESKLKYQFMQWEEEFGLSRQDLAFNVGFQRIIHAAHEKTGKKVVILIDEYEKPILEAMGYPDLQEKHRTTLRGLYGNLKSEDAHIRFVFITGVSKMGKLSVFSELNNLKDISHSDRFAAICGISEHEVLSQFAEDIEALAENQQISVDKAKAKLKELYDGYHFTANGPGMYNPYSLLNAFDSLRFSKFWFATGTPDILAKMIRKNHWQLKKLDGVTATEGQLDHIDFDSDDPIPLLYQTGYLTIKSYKSRIDKYILSYPNREVEEGFLDYLVPFYCPRRADIYFDIEVFIDTLEAGDVDAFMKQIIVLLAGCPYDICYDRELHFQNFIYLLATLTGYYVHAEYKIADGRIDLLMETDDYLYLFEFKYDQTAQIALDQINEKDYALPFTLGRKTTYLIGVNFSHETRNVDGYLVEKHEI